MYCAPPWPWLSFVSIRLIKLVAWWSLNDAFCVMVHIYYWSWLQILILKSEIKPPQIKIKETGIFKTFKKEKRKKENRKNVNDYPEVFFSSSLSMKTFFLIIKSKRKKQKKKKEEVSTKNWWTLFKLVSFCGRRYLYT